MITSFASRLGFLHFGLLYLSCCFLKCAEIQKAENPSLFIQEGSPDDVHREKFKQRSRRSACFNNHLLLDGEQIRGGTGQIEIP